MANTSKLRALSSLTEDVFAAPSTSAIAQLVARDLPALIGAETVRLYLFNRSAKSLESVTYPGCAEPVAAHVDRPPEGIIAAAVRCFRQGSVVNIPRLRRDPAVNPDGKKGLPNAAVFVPLLLGKESLGVMEALSASRFGGFDNDDLAVLKTVSREIVAALEMQRHQALRDQLLKTEKLAANAQWLANATAEVRPRIERILNLLIEAPNQTPHPLLCEARDEALRAAEAVTRLASFAGMENQAACPPDANVDVNTLLAELLHFRKARWDALELRLQNRLSPEPAWVLGQRGQLEHALVDMVIHAERSAAAAPSKLLTLSSHRVGERVAVRISFPSTIAGTAADDSSLKVCQQIANRHGGEFELRSHEDGLAFELDLPLAKTADTQQTLYSDSGDSTPSRPLTLLLVESDSAARQQLVGLLAQRGHRVIPVAEEETPSLAQRMRFDGILWSVRSGGPKWSEYQQLLRERIPAFILVSGGYDAAFASSLAEGGGYLLARPVKEEDLDRVLDALLAKSAVRV